MKVSEALRCCLFYCLSNIIIHFIESNAYWKIEDAVLLPFDNIFK